MKISSDDLAAVIDPLCEALVKVGESAWTTAEAINKAFAAVMMFMASGSSVYEVQIARLRPIATDRQWHLLLRGSPRVRKKWLNALERKLQIRAKRNLYPQVQGKEEIADGNSDLE